mmetsp:Transcript_13765/g.20985  ORF Transcript_13765/g.20985 Transcript_13765/m.20985 type:complete len:308 (-) Transcript_13765:88-1011(-)
MTNYSSLYSAVLSTTFISAAPNILLVLFPNVSQNELMLSMGQALAAGGLLGDVFLHSHGGSGGIWLLVGFTFFFIIDVILRSLEGGEGHDHSQQHAKEEYGKRTTSNGTTTSSSHSSSKFSSTVALNLLADALHNFTDGLAIGASYGVGDTSNSSDSSSRMGWIATISIGLHEIPHELGDYCILLKNGFTKWEAIGLQFVTAVAAFVGTLVGWWVASSSVLPEEMIASLTSGGFVYLATVTILPHGVLESHSQQWYGRILQLLAFLAGIGCLYAVALLEEHGMDGGHDHHGHSHSHGHSHHSRAEEL